MIIVCLSMCYFIDLYIYDGASADKFIIMLTMMQWSILTKMWFIFQHSLPCGPHTSFIGVAALGFMWYRSSHPDPRKTPQLQIWPHHRSDTASKPSWFFYVGEHKIVRWCQSGEYGGWSTSSKPQSRTSAIATTDLCAGSIVLVKQDSLRKFSRPFLNVFSTTV